MTVLLLGFTEKSPPLEAFGALKTLSQLKESQKPLGCDPATSRDCENNIAVYEDHLLPENQIVVLGIDGRLKSFNLMTGKMYWESSLEMNLIESLDEDQDLLSEYYIPTLSGDIIAFSNTSLWNTTAKVRDF